MLDKITNVILASISDYGEQTQNPGLKNPENNMILYGKGSPVDSIGLVSIIVNTEQQIEEQFGVNITLADEKALSQRNSPFRSVQAMAEYISSLMELSQNVQ